MMSGQGELVIKKGDGILYTYNGNFIDNKKDRSGEMTYSDGPCYKGDFKSDKRHGNGTLVTNPQKKYTGEWLDGKMHGHGTLTTNDSVQKGIWKMGEFIEEGC